MTADCLSASDLAALLAQCQPDWLSRYFPVEITSAVGAKDPNEVLMMRTV